MDFTLTSHIHIYIYIYIMLKYFTNPQIVLAYQTTKTKTSKLITLTNKSHTRWE